MSETTLNCKGLRCPEPTLKLTAVAIKLKSGDFISVQADCPTFEKDLRGWCQRMKKILIFIREESDGSKLAQIKM